MPKKKKNYSIEFASSEAIERKLLEALRDDGSSVVAILVSKRDLELMMRAMRSYSSNTAAEESRRKELFDGMQTLMDQAFPNVTGN